MKPVFLLILISAVLFSCNNKRQANTQSELLSSDSIAIATSDSITDFDENDIKDLERISSMVDAYKPFKIAGRWRDKDIIDTLSIHLFSRTLHKEITSPDFFRGEYDYDRLAELMIKLNPVIYVINENNPTDTLKIGEELGQLFGLYFNINDGDLDGDGRDELMYMVNWADWSSTNTFHIASYKNNKWIDLYSFPVWEWQFNEGYENVIQKLPDNKIMINFRNDEAAEDSKIVDLGEIAHQLLSNNK